MIILIGYFFNLTLISSVGGDAVRMWEACRAGLPSRTAVTSVVTERLLQVFAHLGLVAAGILVLVYLRIGDAELRVIGAVLLGASALGFAMLVTFDRLPASWLQSRWASALAVFSGDVRNVLLRPPVVLAGIALGLVNQSGVLFVVYLLAKGLGLPLSFVGCLMVIPVAMLATALPISIGGWGIRESAFVVGFGALGLPTTDALTLSLVFGALNMAVRLPGGFVWLAMRPSGPRPA